MGGERLYGQMGVHPGAVVIITLDGRDFRVRGVSVTTDGVWACGGLAYPSWKLFSLIGRTFCWWCIHGHHLSGEVVCRIRGFRRLRWPLCLDWLPHRCWLG